MRKYAEEFTFAAITAAISHVRPIIDARGSKRDYAPDTGIHPPTWYAASSGWKCWNKEEREGWTHGGGKNRRECACRARIACGSNRSHGQINGWNCFCPLKEAWHSFSFPCNRTLSNGSIDTLDVFLFSLSLSLSLSLSPCTQTGAADLSAPWESGINCSCGGRLCCEQN